MLDFPLVDAHVHLVDLARLRYSWMAGAPALARNWTEQDLLARARPYQLAGAVFVEVDVDAPLQLDEATWVDGLARQSPLLKGAVVSLPLEQGEAAIAPQLERLATLRSVRGIRRLIQDQPDPDFMLQPNFVAALRLLPRYGFSFDICIRHRQFAAAVELVRCCPEVSFVLDHIGKPGIAAGVLDPWRTHMSELAALPNVVCKLSGVLTEADHTAWTREQLRPYIDHTLNSFGFARTMFGGDWPVVELAGHYGQWLAVLDWATASCTGEERRQLFHDTATIAYRLRDGAN